MVTQREHRYTRVIRTIVSLGMSSDTQLCMRPMLIAGGAMYRVRRQSCSNSLVSDHRGTPYTKGNVTNICDHQVGKEGRLIGRVPKGGPDIGEHIIC